MTGWIKLHRCITENEFCFSERFTRMQAWFDLLLLAGYNTNSVFIRGVEINLSPGELCYSQLTLSQRWKWHRKSVRLFLAMLEKREMVSTRKSNVTTVISIRNWELYQANVQQDDHQSDTGMSTNKNDKNIKKYLNSRGSKYLPGKETNGTHKQADPFSIKSRLGYRHDPGKARERLEELKQIFGDY